MRTVSIALRMTIVTIVITGIAYPILVTGIAQVIFPGRANGSLVYNQSGNPIGSKLLGQPFAAPRYFQPRPSAAGSGYDAAASGGSNLGPTSKKLKDRIAVDLERLRRTNPDAPGAVPAELLTASGSGLDPDISPESAMWQAPRVAKARSIDVDRVRRIIEDGTEGRTLGFLGEPRVNVLLLNLALDRQFP